ncbi:hypothetical protein ACET3X_002369 [Alternaria dauci]|uniref:Methyltransferase domain-containing protein n=1 Tax=Alternaria dauci TaxID=48095 RepID=A0ABR3UPX7_9PLEO
MTEAAPVQDPAQEERSSVEQILTTKAYEQNPELLPWYTKELEEPSPAVREIFEKYSKIAPADVVTHIKRVRDDAFTVFPYPCLGNWGFLNFSIGVNPAYQEVLRRIKNGEQFLDLGCCMGQDIRKLVHDGAPSEHTYASDLKKNFWDIGYDMFLDRSTLQTRFVEADIFDADSELKQMDGKMDMVNAASFFHLFDWNQQVEAAKRVVQLLRPVSGSLVVGRQGGKPEAGSFAHVMKEMTAFWHNPESWAKMWKQVGDETGTDWKVQAVLGEEDLSKRMKTSLVPAVMDPYSPEGELINIHSAFHAGAFQQVLNFDTSNFSSSNALPVRVLKLRSQIALGQAQAVSSELASEKTPDLVAVKLLADYEQGKDVVGQAKKLAEQHGQDNLTVQLCVGMILERAGETEAALNVLSKHQGSLDAVALIVQIHLQQNRTDLAAKEAQRARKWAQDSLLVNIAESWVGMREGGEKYQSAFYVFEELATSSQSTSPHSLVAQAVSELHLGRLPEAEAALQQALSIDGTSADTLANLVVLNTLLGKKEDAEQLKSQLQSSAPQHRALADWASKKDEFAKAAAKYTPKFEVAS